MTTAGADQRQITLEVQHSKWQQHRFFTTPLPADLADTRVLLRVLVLQLLRFADRSKPPAASRPGFPKTHLRGGPDFRTQLS